MTITLATLPQATAQEVYSQVRNHLLTQKRKSSLEDDDEECVYRGHDGLKCAAGCLISDEEYLPEMEYKTWGAMVQSGAIPREHKELISSLQRIHDSFPVEDWEPKLNKLAADFNLEPK